jgi:hypothetical protein
VSLEARTADAGPGYDKIFEFERNKTLGVLAETPVAAAWRIAETD